MSSTGVTGVPTTRNWRAGSKRAPRFTPRTVAQIAPTVLAPPPVPQLAGAKKTPEGWLRCFALCLKLDVPPPPPIRRKPTKLRLKRREAPTESWQESQRATLQLTAVPQLASPPSRQAVLQAAATLQRESSVGAARRALEAVTANARDPEFIAALQMAALASSRRLQRSGSRHRVVSPSPGLTSTSLSDLASVPPGLPPPSPTAADRSPVSPTFAPLPPERLPPPPPPRARARDTTPAAAAAPSAVVVLSPLGLEVRESFSRRDSVTQPLDAVTPAAAPSGTPSGTPPEPPPRALGAAARRSLPPPPPRLSRGSSSSSPVPPGLPPPPPPRASRLVPAAAAPAEETAPPSAGEAPVTASTPEPAEPPPPAPPPPPPPPAPPAPPPRRRFLSLPVGRSKPTEATARTALRARLRKQTSAPWGRRGLWRGAAPAPADADPDESRC